MLLAGLLLFIGAVATAATGPLEGRLVSSIAFEPAVQPLPRDELERTVPIRRGDPYRTAIIREAIQKLYSTGRYADIAVDAQPEGQGVAIRFLTTFTFFVGRVAAEGCARPSERRPTSHRGQASTRNGIRRQRCPASGREHTRPPASQRAVSCHRRLQGDSQSGYRADRHRFHHRPRRPREVRRLNRRGRSRPAGRGHYPLHWLEAPHGIFGWRPLTENRLQAGIENVRAYYQRHDRILAQVSLANLPYDEDTNTVVPTLRIVPGPLIRVEAQGAKLSKGKLRQLLPIYQEHSVDRSLLVEGDRNLVEYFQSQGYFDAEVTHSFPEDGSGDKTIEYTIVRQDRHKLLHVEIEGNHYFDRNTIRERMYIIPASLLRFPHGRYSQRYLDRDMNSIQDLYRSNGFRDATVTSKVEDNYLGKKGALNVIVHISEGEQWLVSNLQIEGVPDTDRQYLLSIVHSASAQPFSDYNVATDRDAVLAYYFNNGFPNATFDWNQTPAGEAFRVNLRYLVQPGQRQVVRRVVVNGLKNTRPELVNERIEFGAGDPISQVRISDAQRRLYDLGIFANVQTAVQNPEGDEESKYVLYQVEEARRYSTNVGFGAEIARIGGGVTTFDSPAGATGFAPRVSLGISRLNFFGLGHTVSLQTRFSTLEQRALLSYFAPQFQGNDKLNLTFSALYDNSRDVRTFAARRLEGTVQLGQKITRAETLQYRFSYRDVSVDPNSLKINPQLIPPSRNRCASGSFPPPSSRTGATIPRMRTAAYIRP